MLQAEDKICQEGLKESILKCQELSGGIADKEENDPDVFHTFFGLGAISLVNKKSKDIEIDEISARYAISKKYILDLDPNFEC